MQETSKGLQLVDTFTSLAFCANTLRLAALASASAALRNLCQIHSRMVSAALTCTSMAQKNGYIVMVSCCATNGKWWRVQVLQQVSSLIHMSRSIGGKMCLLLSMSQPGLTGPDPNAVSHHPDTAAAVC